MRIRFAAALLSAVVISALPVAAQAPAAGTQKIDGAWAMNVQTPQGAMDVSMEIVSDGTKITGMISGPQGEVPLEGEYAAGKISFAISIDSPEGAMAIAFSGAVKEDGTMAGMLTGPFGEAPWSASRAK